MTQTTAPGGGTEAVQQTVSPASNSIFDPGSPFADSNGNVAVPNTDLAQQAVDLNTTSLSYDANLQVIRTADKMQGYLLNIFS